MHFQAKRFLIEMFGSPQGLIGLLAAYDRPLPGVFAVEKWFARESVPSDWLVQLLVCLKLEHGAPVELEKYLGD